MHVYYTITVGIQKTFQSALVCTQLEILKKKQWGEINRVE